MTFARRTVAVALILLAGVAALMVSLGVRYLRGRNTNCIIIVLDAARPDHLSCNGYFRPTSPNIDALASEAVIFEQAYATGSYTPPSGASLLTSTYPWNHKVIEHGEAIPSSLTTLQECFGARGFSTAAFLANGEACVGQARTLFDDFTLYELQEPSENVAQQVSQWIAQHCLERFFIFVWFMPPHNPYTPPEEYVAFLEDPSQRPFECTTEVLVEKSRSEALRQLTDQEKEYIIAMYDANLLYADACVGTIFQALKDTDVYDRTAVWIMSDHGEAFAEHDTLLHCGSVYEEEIRIVSILKLPKHMRRTARIATPVSLIDVMPTLVSLFRLVAPAGQMEGINLSRLIVKGHPVERDFLAFRSSQLEPFHGVRFGPYKYFVHPRTGSQYLFDLRSDPGEKNPLNERNPEMLELGARLVDSLGALDDESQWSRPAREMDPETYKRLRALGYIR